MLVCHNDVAYELSRGMKLGCLQVAEVACWYFPLNAKESFLLLPRYIRS